MTIPFSVQEALHWTDGALLSGNAEGVLSGASIDSRSIERGELFVAIVGPNHDGRGFAQGAVQRGAAGLLVESDRTQPETLAAPVSVIGVGDTTLALGALATGHRSEFRGEVVAITGSNGKTTTKEMCASILSIASNNTGQQSTPT